MFELVPKGELDHRAPRLGIAFEDDPERQLSLGILPFVPVHLGEGEILDGRTILFQEADYQLSIRHSAELHQQRSHEGPPG